MTGVLRFIRDDAGVKRVLLLALLAVVALPACGGEVDLARTPAGSAQERFLEDLYNGRFARAYETLHPAHQKLVPRPLFITCARRSVAIHKLDSIEVLDVFDDTYEAPGLGKVRAKAVRVRVTTTTGNTDTFVNHEVKVGSRWRWVFNAAAIRAYRTGRCPGSA